VIDRLLKNQNPLDNRNNLRPSSPHLVVGKRPGAAPQFCGPKFMETRAAAAGGAIVEAASRRVTRLGGVLAERLAVEPSNA